MISDCLIAYVITICYANVRHQIGSKVCTPIILPESSHILNVKSALGKNLPLIFWD